MLEHVWEKSFYSGRTFSFLSSWCLEFFIIYPWTCSAAGKLEYEGHRQILAALLSFCHFSKFMWCPSPCVKAATLPPSFLMHTFSLRQGSDSPAAYYNAAPALPSLNGMHLCCSGSFHTGLPLRLLCGTYLIFLFTGGLAVCTNAVFKIWVKSWMYSDIQQMFNDTHKALEAYRRCHQEDLIFWFLKAEISLFKP